MTIDLHDLQAEDAALAAALTNPNACAYLVEHCRETDFWYPHSRSVLVAVAKLHAAGRPVDPVTVRTAVGSGAKPEDAERLGDYVMHLSESFVVAAHAAEYVGSIVSHSAKRRAILAGGAIRDAAMNANGNVGDLPGRLEVITAEAVEEMRRRGPASAESLRFVPAGAELEALAAERPEYTWWGFMGAGAILDLSGPPKVGKTSFELLLARALLRGDDYLGHMTKRSSVLLMTEQSPNTIGPMLAKVGLRDAKGLYLMFRQEAATAPWADVGAFVRRQTQALGIDVVIVDTFWAWASAPGADENDSSAALAALAPVFSWAADGRAVLLSRHERKGGGALGEAARGSSAYAGAVDVIASLRKPTGNGYPNRRELCAVGRFPDTPDKIVIELGENGYEALGDGRATVREDGRKRLLDIMPSSAATAQTAGELRDRADVARTTAFEILRDFKDKGIICAETGAGSAAGSTSLGYWREDEDSAS